MRVTASIFIDQPIREVFAYATKLECWPEWIPGLLSLSGLFGRRVDVGTDFVQVDRSPRYARASCWEVTEYEPPRVLACRSTTGPHADVRQVFEALNGGTRLTMSSYAEIGGAFADGPEVESAMTRQLETALGRLKELLQLQNNRAGPQSSAHRSSGEHARSASNGDITEQAGSLATGKTF